MARSSPAERGDSESLLLRGWRPPVGWGKSPGGAHPAGSRALFDLRLAGGVISELSPRLEPRPGDLVLDLAGAYLLPGLVDCHVHLGLGGSDHTGARPLLGNARASLLGGVTAVRNLGNLLSPEEEERLRGWGPSGDAPLGVPPSVLAVSAGRALAPAGRYGTFLGREVPRGASLGRLVEEEVARGARVVKLILSGSVDFARGTAEGPYFTAGELAEAVAAASSLGVRVACHANGSEAIRLAAAAGAVSVEHGILAGDDDLRALAAAGTVWVPTLTPLHNLCGDPRWPELAAIFADHLAAVARGRELGVPLVAGTDAGSPGVPHPSLATEVALLTEAGLSGPDLLAAVTWRAAALLGLQGGYGRLHPGARTDLVWFAGDPLAEATFRAGEGWRPAGMVRAGMPLSLPPGA